MKRERFPYRYNKKRNSVDFLHKKIEKDELATPESPGDIRDHLDSAKLDYACLKVEQS